MGNFRKENHIYTHKVPVNLIIDSDLVN